MARFVPIALAVCAALLPLSSAFAAPPPPPKGRPAADTNGPPPMQLDERKLWYAMEEKSIKQMEAAGVDIIVLGGGVSNLERLYRNIPVLWGQYVFSDHVATELRPARFGDSSGVRGAAWLWPAPPG